VGAKLPRGLWLGVRVLPGTTEEEIAQLFLDRCDVNIELGCVSIWDETGSDEKVQAVVSFTDETLCKIISWVTSEDAVGGNPLKWTPPLRPGR
jgi:hypothetical protein